MKQLYSEKSSEFQEQPTQETVQYLINFFQITISCKNQIKFQN